MRDLLAALLMSGIPLVGILTSNVLYDRGVPHYLARKVAHVGAGVYLLVAIALFDEATIPFTLSALYTVGFVSVRLARPHWIRGVGGTGRAKAIAEIWYPAVVTLSIGLGWLWLGSPWLGIVPGLFLSFGDTVTGLTRTLVYHREVKGLWGSASMLGCCLLVAIPLQPYWIGAVGAIVATIAEQRTPATQWVDDNLTLTLSSSVVMVVLFRLWGG